MGSWLAMLTSLCSIQLHVMGGALNKAKDRYIFWNDDYFQKSQQLINQEQYRGKGATAFLEAVNTDINTSRPVYDGLGHVGSACANLGDVMTASSSTYDNRMMAETPPMHIEWSIDQGVFDGWRDGLIQMTLTGVRHDVSYADALSNVLQGGQASIAGTYNQAYQMVEAQVIQDAANYAQMATASNQNVIVQQGQDVPQMQKEIQDYYLMAFNQLASEVNHDLAAWADELMHEYHNFQYAVHNSENYLTSRDLFDYIGTDVDATQSTSKPITITPYKTKDGKNGLLITIGGTDLGNIAYDTDIFTALQTGQSYANPYLDDVRQALRVYMQEHSAMIGAEITLAGYSLGGMTAQQMANDITNGQSSYLAQYHLHVAQVITYGAPVMGAPLKNVQYNMYDATYDPVPLLSSYENPLLKTLDSPLNPNPSIMSYLSPLSPLFGISLGANVAAIGVAQGMPWDMKQHTYIDPSGQYGAQIHNINDVGNTPLGTKGPPVFENHMEYQSSNQLNAASTATTSINAASLGPTEYFGMKNTENYFNKNIAPLGNTISTAGSSLFETIGTYFPKP